MACTSLKWISLKRNPKFEILTVMMYGLLRRYIDLHVREYYFLQWLIHDESMLTFDYRHVMDFKSHYIFLVYFVQLKVLGCFWLKTFNTSELGCKELKIVVEFWKFSLPLTWKRYPMLVEFFLVMWLSHNKHHLNLWCLKYNCGLNIKFCSFELDFMVGF